MELRRRGSPLHGLVALSRRLSGAPGPPLAPPAFDPPRVRVIPGPLTPPSVPAAAGALPGCSLPGCPAAATVRRDQVPWCPAHYEPGPAILHLERGVG